MTSTAPPLPAQHDTRPARLARAFCFAVPAMVLLASFAWLTLDHGTPLLWNVLVHESGRYTFGETVFYFSHFLREVPTVVAYTLFLLGVSGGIARPARHDAASDPGARDGWLALAVAVVLVGGALVVTATSQGWGSALQDLLQYRTRDDLAGYGTHWRYHWLSTLWFGAAAGTAPIIARRIPGTTALRPHRFLTRVAWAYFLGLTLVFGLSPDIFLDVRYAGHQAREILTHGPVTLLLGLGVVLAFDARTGAARRRTDRLADVGDRPGRWVLPLILAALALLVPAYLAAISLGGDVMEQGQAELGLGAMVAAHYFEHTLDYLFFLLLLSGGLALQRSRGRFREYPGEYGDHGSRRTAAPTSGRFLEADP
jgi:hypothetical protein